MFTDFLSSSLPYKERVDLFRKSLRVIIENTNCDAIAWHPSGKLVKPDEFIDSQNSNDIDKIVTGLINVRFLKIQNTDELLMDTRGLAAIGLPDLQCHYRDLDDNNLSILLYNMSAYIYENGDIIANGHTIQGIDKKDSWRCQHEKSLLAPIREVLDINPGNLYAAGNR